MKKNNSKTLKEENVIKDEIENDDDDDEDMKALTTSIRTRDSIKKKAEEDKATKKNSSGVKRKRISIMEATSLLIPPEDLIDEEGKTIEIDEKTVTKADARRVLEDQYYAAFFPSVTNKALPFNATSPVLMFADEIQRLKGYGDTYNTKHSDPKNFTQTHFEHLLKCFIIRKQMIAF